MVQGSSVCGRGYHQRAGGKHAEVRALKDAGEAAQGADLYVTLEPCNHQGKTPPCTESILDAGIKRVFIAMKDPNASVCGNGAERLKTAGVEVHEGICRLQAQQQLREWSHWLRSGLPYVTGRVVLSLDGDECREEGLSGVEISKISRAKFVREFSRYEASIELIAGESKRARQEGEALASSPRIRAILTDSLKQVFAELGSSDKTLTNCIVIAASDQDSQTKALLEAQGAQVSVVEQSFGPKYLREVLGILGTASAYSVICRCAETTKLLLAAGLLDELSVCRLPLFLGSSAKKPFLSSSSLPIETGKWNLTTTRRCGKEALSVYSVSSGSEGGYF